MPLKSSYLTLINDKLLIGKCDNDSNDFDFLHFACRDIDGDVTIPSTVKQIGYFCFEDCKRINSIRFEPDSQLEKIKVGAFYSSMVNRIDLPSSVIEIERECFINCLNLSEISIPSSVTRIGWSCFSNCTNLEKVNFSPDSKITANEGRMFYESGIECISIPSTVTVIGQSAFYNCKRLKSIQIPSESNLESIENEAFASSSIESLFIPSKLEIFGERWCNSTLNFSTISISPENDFFSEIDGQIIIRKSNKANQFFDNFVFAVRTIEYLTAPSCITTLCKSCLSGCNKLKSVTFLPDSMLTTIEEGAFAPSSLLCLTLPPSYKKVTSGAFDKCENFVSIELLADSVEIEVYSFSMVSNLLIASAPNTKEFKFSDHNLREEFTIFVLANSIVDSQPNESKCLIS